ncbi:MAG: SpoIIE family protein phosphatase [archaeon]|nr:SpoIIE family protein phosphatase [archaeon]
MLSYSTAEKMVDSIMECVEDYGNKIPEDDMTLIIIKTDH